jgi:hypothetical protein
MEIGTTQNQIYRLENPAKTKPTISTLKKIANVFDVALVVHFVPFGHLIDWAAQLSPTLLAPASFEEENQLGLGNIPADLNESPGAVIGSVGPTLVKSKRGNASAASQLDKSAA